MYLEKDYQIIVDYFLTRQQSFTLHTHEPMYTTEASSKLSQCIPGAHSKNLFVKDKKHQYFLISVLDHKRVNLNLLSKSVARGRFSFCSPEELLERLGVKPGSVTPFGLINDTIQSITFLFDQDFFQFETVNFHPLRNDMTLSIPLSVFLGFCEHTGHLPRSIEVPV